MNELQKNVTKKFEEVLRTKEIKKDEREKLKEGDPGFVLKVL